MAPSFLKVRITAPALVGMTLLALLVQAHAAGPAAEPLTVERLKQIYLACEQEAATRGLTPPEAAACSHVAEQLLRRGFDGDLDQLLAWWHASRTRAAARPS